MAMTQVDTLSLPPEGSEAWLALSEFFGLPWFQRVWIVQEYAVSQSVSLVYGSQTYSAPFASALLDTITQHGLSSLLRPDSIGWEEELESAKSWTRVRWLTKLRSGVKQVAEPYQTKMVELLDRGVLHKAFDHRD
jgi:hypothetical protein